LFDVQSARGDIGANQHLRAAFLEFGQRLRALALGAVAVDRFGGNAVLTSL
jgi:hypothetical protein